MSFFDEPVAVVSLIVGVVSLIIILYQSAYRYGQLSLKVDTIWEAFIRGSYAEASKERLVKHGSDFLVDATKVRQILGDELVDEVLKDSQGLSQPPVDSWVRVERRYGQRVMEATVAKHISYRSVMAALHALIEASSNAKAREAI